jgi:hypothetical protein
VFRKSSEGNFAPGLRGFHGLFGRYRFPKIREICEIRGSSSSQITFGTPIKGMAAKGNSASPVFPLLVIAGGLNE